MGVTNTSLHFLPDFLPRRNPLHRKRACRLLEKPRSTSVWNLLRIVNKNWIQKDCDLNRFCSCVITPLPSFIIVTIVITTTIIIIVYRQHHHQAAFWLPCWHSTTPSVDVIQDTPTTIHPPAPQRRKNAQIKQIYHCYFLGLVLTFGHFHAQV